MTDLTALIYVSSASHPFTEDELERLLVDARGFNAAQHITGVLLYDDGNFFQFIEGPSAGLQQAYERIKSSKAHHGIIELFHRPVSARCFKDWSMGFSRAPRSVVLNLSQASWKAVIAENSGESGSGTGMKLLFDFWSLVNRG